MPSNVLVIANKNYSSWSMRPWVAMTHFKIPFEEVKIYLGKPDTTEQILRYSPTGKVPSLLLGDELRAWDSLAIIETLQDAFPELNIFPLDPVDRAVCRSVCAEMHSGFVTLRNCLPMNIKEDYAYDVTANPALQADIARIEAIFASCLQKSGGPYLFGDFTAADAMYSPVVMRFKSYQVPVSATTAEYMKAVQANEAVAQWVSGGLQEEEILPHYERSK